MANLRFLAQGRRPMFLDASCVAAVAAAGRAGMTLREAEAGVEGFDSLDVRASALSLLWRRVWRADLSRPLSSESIISELCDQEPVCQVAS